MTAKCQGGKDADFAAGVVPFDIGGGILLGIAVFLGLLQRRSKAQPRPDHAGEDIVGGAVEDAADLGDLIGGQALIQRADDGDTAPTLASKR